MSHKEENANLIAVKFLGGALIVTLIRLFMYLIVSNGYSTYLSFSKEKIEVRAMNSNSFE